VVASPEIASGGPELLHLLAALAILLLAAVFGPVASHLDQHSPTPIAWGAVLWLGIAATAAAFLALNRELREAGASQSPVHLLLVSLVAALLSYLLIDELVTSPQAIGGGLILVGTLIANWRPLPSGG
jgi:drug/metabolite transporter (DMT)-like permease